MERRLTAILFYDVVGYSISMGRDEASTIEALKANRSMVIAPIAKQHSGRTIQVLGDGGFMEFASAVDAVRFAIAMQNAVAERNLELPEEQCLIYRIGINIGDVVADDDFIYGDGVNIAARLEGLAQPGGICVHQTVRDQVQGKLDLDFDDLGEKTLKNISRPVRAFHVILDAPREVDNVKDRHLNTATSIGTAPTMQPQTLPDKPSIAVLPFSNMSTDPEQEYFSYGITESIINGLARFREILVIGVKSILIVRDQASDLREIGRILGVAHIVEGSVQKVGNRIRVTVQLIDASNGQRMWAENYDRDFGDIFAVQDEITNVLVSTLAGQIEYLELQRVVNRPTNETGAYDCLLKGRRGLNLYTRSGVIEARLQFKRALDIDPDYAAAFAGLALSYIQEYEGCWSNNYEECLDQVEKYAQKAIAIDNTDSQALYSISAVSYYRGQFEMAKAYVEKALELNPNDYHNMCQKGYFLAFSDQTSESIACSIEAMRWNPLTPENCLFSIGVAEYVAGRYKESLASFCKTKGWGLLRPAFIAACYAQLNRNAEAQIATSEVWALASNDPSAPEKVDEAHWQVYWSRIMKFEDPIYWEKFLEGIRKAGLPG